MYIVILLYTVTDYTIIPSGIQKLISDMVEKVWSG